MVKYSRLKGVAQSLGYSFTSLTNHYWERGYFLDELIFYLKQEGKTDIEIDFIKKTPSIKALESEILSYSIKNTKDIL